MKWSPQQDMALKEVDAWVKGGREQVFRLFGFAGTGKTTLAKHLASGVNGRVQFGAYTGKAAFVLNSKGCPAKTIHQLIYTPKHKSKEKHKMLLELLEKTSIQDDIERIKKEIKAEEDNLKRMSFSLNTSSVLKDTGLVIIDECSMVDKQMGEDLLSFGCKVLVLGDPAQLPPIKGGGYFTEVKPDIMLTEIHRQARESPIIEMATMVRTGKSLHVGRYGNCTVFPLGERITEIAKAADQVICGKNATRHSANKRIREFLNLPPGLPLTGDRLVCLRNDHEVGLLNGQIWIAAGDAQDCGDHYLIEAYNEDCEEQAQVLDIWKGEPNWFDKLDHQEFDYGYCLTCHKSQGSQWQNVLVLDESQSFRKDADRWLYTAITRAAEEVNVMKMR